MNEASWWMAAALTFAGSVHCVGMCGGFVLALAARKSGRGLAVFGNHLLLQLGKATSYAFLGALSGALGMRLMHHPALVQGEKVFAIVAAVGLALAGLTLLGLRSGQPGSFSQALAQAWGRFVGPLLTERPAGGALVVGLAMGFLPCPLVYAGLAAAAVSGSALAGAAILGGVALGTIPALGAIALAGQTLPERARRWLVRSGGVLLLVVAAITLLRALGAGHGHH